MRGRGLKRAYFLYLAALLIISAALLVALWRILVRYQADAERAQAAELMSRQEERAPQIAFEDYMGRTDAAWWSEQYLAERAAGGETVLDTPRQVREYFEDLLAVNEVLLFKADAWTGARPVYAARVGGAEGARAEVVLAGAGLFWSVCEVHVAAAGRYGGEIEAPAGSRVFCGRTELDDNDLLPGENARFPFPSYSDVLEEPVVWRTWRVSGLLCEPTLTVTDADGRAVEMPDGEVNAEMSLDGDADAKSKDADATGEGDLVWSETDGCAVYRVTGEDAERLERRADAFLRAYLSLTTGGREVSAERLANCLGLLKRNSEAYQVLFGSRWSIAASMAYTDLRIEVLADDMSIRWAKNACSVDIRYHAYARQGGVEKDYSGEDQLFRVLFLDQGNGWEICAFQIE